MAEPRDRLTDAFTDLAVAMMREVHLPGPAAAQTMIRQRRRRRLAMVAAVVALLIAAPFTAFALLRGTINTDPDIGNTPTPSATTATPTPSPSSSPQPAGLRVIADNNVRASTPLDNARLPVPAFGAPADGCPEGETQYTDATWQGARIGAGPAYVTSRIYSVATGDVNLDGTLDWVVGISCVYGTDLGANVGQIVAFTRDGDGPYVLVGQVIVPDGGRGAGSAEVSADGIIRVVVGGAEGDPTIERHSFRWSGSGFTLVGTPVVIPSPQPSNLRVTVSPSTLSGPVTVLSVTVHNAGPDSTEYLILDFATFEALSSLSIRPAGFATDLQPHSACLLAFCTWSATLEPVAPGQSETGQFTVEVSGDPGGYLFVHVSGGALHNVPNVTTQNGVRVPIGTE